MAENGTQKAKKHTLATFAQAHGLERGKHCCYGVWNGYRVHVKRVPFGNPACLVTVVTDASGKEEKLNEAIKEQKRILAAQDKASQLLGRNRGPATQTVRLDDASINQLASTIQDRTKNR